MNEDGGPTMKNHFKGKEKVSLPTNKTGPDLVVGDLVKIIDSVLNESSLIKKDLSGIGISYPRCSFS